MQHVSATRPIRFGAGLLLALSPLAFAQDTTIPGFALDTNARPIGVFDAYATLGNGDRIVFDGLDVNRVDDAGALVLYLGSVPAPTFASFVVLDPSGSFALVAESSNGKLYAVDVGGAGIDEVAELDFAYDAVFEDATHVLISAAPCGFNCGSEIYRLDVTNGATTLVGGVTGPSGPLAIHPATGELYYCLQSPNFNPDEYSIIRWTSTQVAAGGLTPSNATVFASGLDSGSSMRFDNVYGHLFLTESVFNGGTELIEFDAAGNDYDHPISSTNSLSNIEFLYGPGPGSFQAFQPAGVTLRYRSIDFNAFTAEIRVVESVRPQATMSGPGLTGPGSVTFTVTGAHPDTSFLILTTPAASYDPMESAVDVGSYLFHTGMPLDQLRRLVRVDTDSTGTGSFTYFNPGTLQGTRVFQALVIDADDLFVGSSTAASN